MVRVTSNICIWISIRTLYMVFKWDHENNPKAKISLIGSENLIQILAVLGSKVQSFYILLN